jgi:hypothetical protein
MSRRKHISHERILELLIDSDNDGLSDIDVDDHEQPDDDDVVEQEETIYHDVTVLVEGQVIFYMSYQTDKDTATSILPC